MVINQFRLFILSIISYYLTSSHLSPKAHSIALGGKAFSSSPFTHCNNQWSSGQLILDFLGQQRWQHLASESSVSGVTSLSPEPFLAPSTHVLSSSHTPSSAAVSCCCCLLASTVTIYTPKAAPFACLLFLAQTATAAAAARHYCVVGFFAVFRCLSRARIGCVH